MLSPFQESSVLRLRRRFVISSFWLQLDQLNNPLCKIIMGRSGIILVDEIDGLLGLTHREAVEGEAENTTSG